MFLRQEIETLLIAKNSWKEDRLEKRDLKILLEYFGFGEDKFPVPEKLGDKHGGGSRQNVHEDIIKTKFKNKIQIEELPSLIKIHELLQGTINEHGHIFYSDLLDLLIEKDLIEDSFHLKGLFNLLECFDLSKGLDIYAMSMIKATKKDIAKDDELLIAKKVGKEIQEKLEDDIRKILKLPGRIIGICCLNDVYEKYNNLLLTFPVAKRALQNTNTVWCKEIDNRFWFLVETRGNPIITTLGKIKRVGVSFQKEILIKVVENTLLAHALPSSSSKLIRPTENIIANYLDYSRYVTTNEKDYVIQDNLELSDLSDAEVDVIEYFENRVSDTSFNIIEYLKQKNQKRQNKKTIFTLRKNCFNSPFLYKSPSSTPMKKKGERWDFFFIKNYFGSEFNAKQNDYQFFRNKLFDLYGQTDIDKEVKMRIEQPILQDWLFKNKVVEKCAICGKEYSVKSLVTAHKKPRSKCSENERTDPYIVMPACKFGCDHVYEKKWIKIVNGIVEENETQALGIPTNERQYIKSIQGRKLDEKWMQGDTSYFNFTE